MVAMLRQYFSSRHFSLNQHFCIILAFAQYDYNVLYITMWMKNTFNIRATTDHLHSTSWNIPHQTTGPGGMGMTHFAKITVNRHNPLT